jgi:hypothetical protein
MSRDDGMDEQGIDYSSMDVIWYDGFGSEVGLIKADLCHVLTTKLTQHDSHGPDDCHKTID